MLPAPKATPAGRWGHLSTKYTVAAIPLILVVLPTDHYLERVRLGRQLEEQVDPVWIVYPVIPLTDSNRQAIDCCGVLRHPLRKRPMIDGIGEKVLRDLCDLCPGAPKDRGISDGQLRSVPPAFAATSRTSCQAAMSVFTTKVTVSPGFASKTRWSRPAVEWRGAARRRPVPCRRRRGLPAIALRGPGGPPEAAVGLRSGQRRRRVRTSLTPLGWRC
jgi:hypothetical protein